MGNDQALWLAVGGLAVLCLVLLVVMLPAACVRALGRGREVDALR